MQGTNVNLHRLSQASQHAQARNQKISIPETPSLLTQQQGTGERVWRG